MIRNLGFTNIEVLRVLEDIKEADDVGVLAQLEHFYLPPLQLQLLQLHVPLLDALNGHLLPSLLVDAELNLSEFALPEVLLNVVEIFN